MHDRMIAPERLDENELGSPARPAEAAASAAKAVPADAGAGDALLAGAPVPGRLSQIEHAFKLRRMGLIGPPPIPDPCSASSSARVVVRQANGNQPIEVVVLRQAQDEVTQAVAQVSASGAIDLATELLRCARRAMAAEAETRRHLPQRQAVAKGK